MSKTMSRMASTFVLLLLIPGVAYLQNCTWTPKLAPLMTRWASQVSSSSVLSEYPRMQMQRASWLNLNGVWEFEPASNIDSPPFGQHLSSCVLVPFAPESALSGIMQHSSMMWYRKVFAIPKTWGGRILIHFGAIDWQSKVYVNGQLVGVHSGGYDPFTFDITSYITSADSQEVIVGVFDPTDQGDQPRGKQTLNPQGIWFSAVSGIWQTVWVEPVPDTYISGLTIVPDIDRAQVNLSADVRGADSAISMVHFIAQSNGSIINQSWCYPGSQASLSIPDQHLWTPNDPFLYELKVYLYRNNVVVDSVTSYFAMRKVSIGKDATGRTKILLNNNFVFQMGVLDQGYWPDGLYTPPADSAIVNDLQTVKKLGFNLIRKHVKVEPDRWYYWCDKLGILVWQDMPNGNNVTLAGKNEFQSELFRIIDALRNHPCIIMWVVFNEGWGQFNTTQIVAGVKQADPTRLVDDASGWVDYGVGDVVDMHLYPGPPVPVPSDSRAAVVGEFGGGWLEIQGHTWQPVDGKGLTSPNALANFYLHLADSLQVLKDNFGLSAAIYTELTDVEQEYAGLMTYDREMIKCYYFAILSANMMLLTKVRENMNQGHPSKFFGQNYPNPFNGATTFTFSVPTEELVKIDIFDTAGRLVKVVTDSYLSAGTHTVRWDGKDQSGAVVPTGIYLWLITAGGEKSYRKVVFLK